MVQIVWTCRATLRANEDDQGMYHLIYGAENALVSVAPTPPPPAQEKPPAQEL